MKFKIWNMFSKHMTVANVGLMSGQRLRRSPNIKSTYYAKCLMFYISITYLFMWRHRAALDLRFRQFILWWYFSADNIVCNAQNNYSVRFLDMYAGHLIIFKVN